MGALDDALKHSASASQVADVLGSVERLHGYGWHTVKPAPKLEEIARDFIGKLRPSSGQAGFWHEVLGRQVVHVARPKPPAIPPKASMFGRKAAAPPAAQEDHRFDARVLVLGDAWDALNLSLVQIAGTWHPAEKLSSGSILGYPSDWADYNYSRALRVMVDFVDRGEYYEQRP